MNTIAESDADKAAREATLRARAEDLAAQKRTAAAIQKKINERNGS